MVLKHAMIEASRFNHEHIGTEHILLGTSKEGSSAAARLLNDLGIDLRKLRIEVDQLVPSDHVLDLKLPQTPRHEQRFNMPWRKPPPAITTT